jgi:hypothetical protein
MKRSGPVPAKIDTSAGKQVLNNQYQKEDHEHSLDRRR